jgi:hypothetical protein
MPDIDEARAEALHLSVELHAAADPGDPFSGHPLDERVIETAGRFASWLLARPVRIKVGNPVISEQADPARFLPFHRTGADMAVTMTDSQIATYPAPEALDSKGFEVADAITVSESSAGAVVALVDNADGTATLTAVAPGASQVTWTDGTISFSDTVNVTDGPAATIVVGAPVITDQAPAAPPA